MCIRDRVLDRNVFCLSIQCLLEYTAFSVHSLDHYRCSQSLPYKKTQHWILILYYFKQVHTHLNARFISGITCHGCLHKGHEHDDGGSLVFHTIQAKQSWQKVCPHWSVHGSTRISLHTGHFMSTVLVWTCVCVCVYACVCFIMRGFKG